MACYIICFPDYSFIRGVSLYLFKHFIIQKAVEIVTRYYARQANNMGEKETVKHHLQFVSRLCGEFAEVFGCTAEGHAMGMLHDFGKYSESFQQVLDGKRQNVDHASPGAYLFKACYLRRAASPSSSSLWPMVVAIRAHHGTLDYACNSELFALESGEQYNSMGEEFSIKKDHFTISLEAFLRENKLPSSEFSKPDFNQSTDPNIARMLYTRMLFSTLVDADYSAAAQHFDEEYLEKTTEPPLDIEQAFKSFEYYLLGLTSTEGIKEIDKLRNNLLHNCLQAGTGSPGLYTLTAPTGTGKTLALLAFALAHMETWNKRRIIIVLPYLTITEQNAKVYRCIIPSLLEDHSQSSLPDKARDFVQRWSSRFILTTSVRFFEGLFASKSTECRHLHHIADSVIIFDEAQSLPPRLIGATLHTVKELCSRFKCTVVFSTATQPSFNYWTDLDWKPREIVEDPQTHFFRTRRVNIDWRTEKRTSLTDLAQEMSKFHNVCTVVNIRAHARKLFKELELLVSEGLFLITTDLCPAHRSDVLDNVRKRLAAGLTCRLVSTQCIEAGVDISFDILYRALAPLEAIIQASGRCNRHDIEKKGQVVIFIPDEDRLYPDDFYQLGANTVLTLSSRHNIDIYDLKQIDEYYRLLYDSGSVTDKNELRHAIELLEFAEVSKQYKLIDNKGVQVIVPYNKELFDEITDEARTIGLSPALMKKAAPITVSCYEVNKVKQYCEHFYLRGRGRRFIGVESGWYALGNPVFYNDRLGLDFETEFDGIT